MDEDLALGLFVLVLAASGGLLWVFASNTRANRAETGWARLVVGNSLVLSFLLALLSVGGEIYYRFLYDTSDSLDYTKVSQRWFQRHWQVNSSDCRDNVNYSLNIKPGKRRITFVGDSFTAGHGINDVEQRFANLIRRTHPEWEIHLLAQPGFDTGNELKYLEGCLSQHYQIDQVVLVYCLNDVGDLFPEWAEAVECLQAEAARSGWLRRNSYLVNTLYYRIAAARNPAMKRYYAYMAEGYRGENWEQQQRRLKAFRDLVESHGGRLAVITFPFFQALGSHYEYQSAHDKLNQCWHELGVAHLDLLPLYRNLPPRKLTVNRFDAHPNEYAHALAAAAIENFLKEELQVAPDQRSNPSSTVKPSGASRRSNSRASSSANKHTKACPRVRASLREKIGRSSNSPVLSVRKSRSTLVRSR
jgi:lysophospholipase L1-like esterase